MLTGDAPTISEWSTISLLTKVRLILDVSWYPRTDFKIVKMNQEWIFINKNLNNSTRVVDIMYVMIYWKILIWKIDNNCIFTQGQFWPLGIVVVCFSVFLCLWMFQPWAYPPYNSHPLSASVCFCVCECANPELIHPTTLTRCLLLCVCVSVNVPTLS